MLDDLAFIARFDSENALAVVAGSGEQLAIDQSLPKLPNHQDISSIVLSGMGGSALAGLLMRDWLSDELAIPLVITRDYHLPGFVDKNTLVIASSYSGNTEETLSALQDAEAKEAQIIVITAGGKLAELARTKKYPLLLLPADYQPRMTTNFFIKLLTEALVSIGLVKDKSRELKSAQTLLSESAKGYLPQVKTTDNYAKQLAQEIAGRSAIIYGSPMLSTAAYKWKINCNENAKNLAFYNQLPEFNHNEFMGWTGKPADKPFAIIELSSSLDHPQVAKRFKVSNRLLSGKMPDPVTIQAQGKSKLEQILWTVQLGDFTSLYLAILNQTNPTPVDLIEKLKQQLS